MAYSAIDIQKDVSNDHIILSVMQDQVVFGD